MLLWFNEKRSAGFILDRLYSQIYEYSLFFHIFAQIRFQTRCFLADEEPLPQIHKGDKKVIRGWVMYDWANSVYQLTITSAIFPIYFIAVTTHDKICVVSFFGIKFINSVLYSYSISFAFLIVAVFSPLLSSFADYTGRRKSFMKTFTWIGSLACGTLIFFTGSNVELGTLAFVFGTIGYAGSIVFYNSFLPVIAEPQDQDRISARGYAMGYLGGVILLIFNLLMIQEPGWFGIPRDSTLAARISFLSVCLWWIGFAQITFRRLPKYTYRKRFSHASVWTNGYRELRLVFNQVRKSFRLSMYLFGFFFMMSGVLTIMYMSVTYGKKQLQLDDNVLVLTILMIQFVGMFGAWFFARLSGWLGNLKAMIISIVSWIPIVIGAYFITNATGFMSVAFFVGLVMGGSQSLARSTYSKMLPETTDHTSFFSFYDVLEKLATVAGTFSFGIIESITKSMRNSVLAIMVYFIISLLFMLTVWIASRKKGAAALTSLSGGN
jgi:UMF1 family MFS transporter